MQGRGGNPAQGGSQSDHIAVGSRVTQGAPHVRAVRKGHHAGSQRRRRTAGTAAGDFGQVPGVFGAAKQGVESVRAGAKFRRIGFANDKSTCGFQARYKKGIFLRHVLRQDR